MIGFHPAAVVAITWGAIGAAVPVVLAVVFAFVVNKVRRIRQRRRDRGQLRFARGLR